MSPRPRAMLLDLDGVLRTWDPRHVALAEERSGLPAGAIHRVAFDAEFLLPALTGAISDETWRQLIGERLRTAFPTANPDFAISLWSAFAGEVDPDVLALVRACRQRVPVVLISNATTRLARDLERLGIATEFDHIVNSSHVGHAKPEWEIFERALMAAGVSAVEAFFVDDDAKNVAAAGQFGIQAHAYQGHPHLRAELTRCGLIA